MQCFLAEAFCGLETPAHHAVVVVVVALFTSTRSNESPIDFDGAKAGESSDWRHNDGVLYIFRMWTTAPSHHYIIHPPQLGTCFGVAIAGWHARTVFL